LKSLSFSFWSVLTTFFELFRDFAGSKDPYIIKNVIVRALRIGRGLSLWSKVYLLCAEAELACGNHSRLVIVANHLVKNKKNPYGHFYLGLSCFLLGDYVACREELHNFISHQIDCPDAVYLLAEVEMLVGDYEASWQHLEGVSRSSKRLKTWMYMALLVRNDNDFQRLLSCHQQAQNRGLAPLDNVSVNGYLIDGALRCHNYDYARREWQRMLLQRAAKSSSKTVKGGKPNFSPARARTALLDLARVLAENEIPMFLVSGTLLGCIRDGDLLAHDKDIDVGIWEDIPRDQLMKALRSCGLFYVLYSRAHEIVRIKHVNGIAIDVFYHYRGVDGVRHGGVKVSWHNTPFSLTERNFLGEKFLIPEDYDRYLTENYGDWKTPKIDFDSSYDTPNLKVISQDELAIYTYNRLYAKLSHGNESDAETYLKFLEALGEGEFIDDFRRMCCLRNSDKGMNRDGGKKYL
jgi:hypothetical protein